MSLRTYSVRYREKGEPFEANPTYYYACFICDKVVHGPKDDGLYRSPGQQVIDVLRNGKTWTVHQACNRNLDW